MEEEIKKLTDLVKQLQQEKETAEKKLETSSQKWEDRFKRLEENIEASKSVPNAPARGAFEITVPIGPNREVQEAMNVQVEHVVRGDHGISFHNRVRPFSGNTPKNGEVSFEEWSKQLELVLEDTSLSDKGKKQKLFSSLHAPALDLARSLDRDATAQEVIDYLTELYGSAANGVRLLHEFFRMQKDSHENLGEYLQRLAIKAQKVVKRGGLKIDQVDETILTHFKATCLDEKVSQILHMKYDTCPPTLTDLMKDLKRIEEDFKPSKKEPAQKAKIHVQSVESEGVEDRLTKIEAQLKEFTEKVVCAFQASSKGNQAPQKVQGDGVDRRTMQQNHPQGATQGVPRGGNGTRRYTFCYKCGQTDGHYMQQCENAANPVLVQEHLIERQARSRPLRAGSRDTVVDLN